MVYRVNDEGDVVGCVDVVVVDQTGDISGHLAGHRDRDGGCDELEGLE